ncbi:MAG: TolC family protein [Desulfobacterales bacterium]|nr:TolC family protein [Desulfobacterales bacterium]
MKRTHGGKALGLAMILALLWTPAAAAGDRLTLDQAVTRGLANNRLIRAAMEASRAAVAAQTSAKSDFFPDLSATYQYTGLTDTPFMYFTKAVVNPGGLTVGSQRIEAPTGTRDNYAWYLRLTQPLFTGFALTTRYKMAETGIAAKQVERAQAELDVIRQVRLAYVQILAAQRRLAVAEEAVAGLQAHVKDAERFYDQGLIPNNDLLQSQVALAAAEQQRAEVQGRVRMAVAALNILIGYDLDRDTQVAEIAVESTFIPELDTLRRAARDQRPEPQALTLAITQIDQGINLAQSVYYPQLALVGQYQQEGDNPGASRNNFRNAQNASMTLQAQWLFHTGGKTRADVSRLRHQRKALEERRLGIQESIDLEVMDVRIRLEVAAGNIGTAEKALEQARENLRITTLRYQQQIATSTEVLDATTARTQAQTNYYGALYGYEAARAELDRAVGRKTFDPAKG